MVRRFIIYLGIAILSTSCSDKGDLAGGDGSEMANFTISASMDSGVASAISRTTTSDPKLEEFDNKDQIGVFLCRAGTNGATAHTTSHYKNLWLSISQPIESGYSLLPIQVW